MDSFLSECCIVETDQQAKASTLYARYQRWCESRGQTPVTQRGFGGWLKERFERKRKKDGCYWLGIGLLDDEGEPSPNGSPRPERASLTQADVVLEILESLEKAMESDLKLKGCIAFALQQAARGDVLMAVRTLKTCVLAHQSRV